MQNPSTSGTANYFRITDKGTTHQFGSLALGKLTNINGTLESNASSTDKFKYSMNPFSESFVGNAQML